MSRRAWIGFAALSVIWGIPYLFIKIAVDDGMTPVELAWGRVVLAAVVLLGLAWHAGTLDSLRGKWPWLAGYALIEIALPFPLLGFGEQRVSSSLAAIIIASVPLLVALLALRFEPGERATGRRLAGLLIGFCGVVALVGIDVGSDSRELLGAAAVLGAALGYAGGPLLLNRHLSGLDARATMGASLAIAALLLTPALLAGGPHEVPGADGLMAVAVLGLICTAAAFVLLSRLIGDIGPSRALVITYVNPVVAVGLGIVALDEHPGPGAILGLALIISGSWLSTRGPAPVAAH